MRISASVPMLLCLVLACDGRALIRSPTFETQQESEVGVLAAIEAGVASDATELNDASDALEAAEKEVEVPDAQVDAWAEIPPSKASCTRLEEEGKSVRVTDLERWCCPRADQPAGGTSCLATENCGEPSYRIMIWRYAVGFLSSHDELRMLRTVCRHQQKAVCISCVNWRLQNP